MGRVASLSIGGDLGAAMGMGEGLKKEVREKLLFP